MQFSMTQCDGDDVIDEESLAVFWGPGKFFDTHQPAIDAWSAMKGKEYDGELGLTKKDVFTFMVETFLSDPVNPRTVDVMKWLVGSGYDLTLQRNFCSSEEEALALQLSQGWNQQTSVRFAHLMHTIADRCGEGSVLNLTPTQIRVQAGDLDGLGLSMDEPFDMAAFRLKFVFLKKFNTLFMNLLPLIDLRHSNTIGSMACLLNPCRPFVFTAVKTSFLEKMLDLSAEDCKTPKVTVNRTNLASRKNTGEVIDFIEHSHFATVQKQLRDLDPVHLRTRRPHGTEPFIAFEVVFEGEHVVGEAGPYRQIFSDFGHELQDLSCPMLIPCPNSASSSGENRDKWVLRPGRLTGVLRQMFEFLGTLFGICIRTGVRFPLDLPAFVWKPLVDQPLTRADLAAVDQNLIQILNFVESCDVETLDASLNDHFTIELSDGQIVELKENGAGIKVNSSNRAEYVELVLKVRLNEHAEQISAIKTGLGRIFPVHLLSLLSWEELEIAVCGVPTIDIELLRRHTKYGEGLTADSLQVEMLWSILTEFSQQQRRMFIRFAWAQERLPTDDAEFERTHTRLLIKPAIGGIPDVSLPRSDTCFFNLELPHYSTTEIMRDKLLYAISTTMSMNADQNVEDIHGTGTGRPSGRRNYDDW